jgi:Zn-dependent protease/CBS domain-containing protein
VASTAERRACSERTYDRSVSESSPGGRARGGLAFRVGSVPVVMPWSGVLGVLIIAWLWSPSFAQRTAGGGSEIVVALVFAVLFYASILLHELGHAVVARYCGYPVEQIVLWVLGGYTSYRRDDESSWREGLIAAAGPITSLLLGGFCAVLGNSGIAGSDPRVLAVLSALAWSNTLLGVYNALPGLPLDGGAVLKSVVWAVTDSEHRGTVIAGWTGRVVAVAVFVLPLLPYLLTGQQPPLPLVVIGLLIAGYLFAGANDALRRSRLVSRLPTLSASQLARTAVPVAADLPLSEALRQVDAARAGGFVVVDPTGRPVAIGNEDAVRAVPLQRRPWVPASSVARSVAPGAWLGSGLVGRDLLAAMQDHPAADYLVVDEHHHIVGVLATADVERALTTA